MAKLTSLSKQQTKNVMSLPCEESLLGR